MRIAPAAAVLLTIAACSGGAQPQPKAGAPVTPAPAAPEAAAPAAPEAAAPEAAAPAPPRIRPLCGNPDEAQLRAAYPSLPPCSRGRPIAVLAGEARGHRLLVAAWGNDPCCSDVLGPATAAGAAVFVDGRELPRDRRFAGELGDLSGVDEPTASLLLQGILLEHGAVDAVLDEADAAALAAAWPAASAPLAARPPGLRRDGGDFQLWLWTTSAVAELGIDCRYLDGWGARLTAAGELSVVTGPGFAEPARHARYSEGSARGERCDGEPFPAGPR